MPQLPPHVVGNGAVDLIFERRVYFQSELMVLSCQGMLDIVFQTLPGEMPE